MVADFNYDIDSKRYLAHGINVFQASLLNDSEQDTVQMIHDLLQPHDDSVILDMGAGCGGVAKIMLNINDTLKFICVTNSKFQNEYIEEFKSKSIASIFCDFHHVPLPDESVDYIMFNETIGYGDLTKLIFESNRLLKKGGRLIIKDFLNYSEKDYLFTLSNWGYKLNFIDDFKNILNKFSFHIHLITPIAKIASKKFFNFIKNDPYMRAKYNSDKNIKYDSCEDRIDSLVIVASK